MQIIADSVVGVTFIRNLISTMFVFALQPWTDRVGLTWFYVTFGLIATVILMGNLFFVYWGKKLRVKGAARLPILERHGTGHPLNRTQTSHGDPLR